MLQSLPMLLLALLLVALNGFFVAAEFALVKVRMGRIDELVRNRRPFARAARWVAERLEGSLSACQLGITMASLALGWVAEPAFVRLIEPVFHWIGLNALFGSLGIASVALHTTAIVIAFTLITSLHLVIGEQAPKIYAIRRPEPMLLWCAPLLIVFYVLTWPLMSALNATTSFLLKSLGVKNAGEHGSPHSEQEIRALVSEAHLHGSLTRAEHRLIDAVFEFDDTVCRQILLPRGDVEFFDVNDSVEVCIDKARRTKHTRYPLCDGSLDEVIGVVHVKDLIGVKDDDKLDLRSISRPPRKVPETMPISKLLRHFQASHQLLAFVIDEYGTIIGIATLENVLERIIGNVEDEFDTQQPNIVPDGPDQWIIQGSTPVEEMQKKFAIEFGDIEADTFSGLLMEQAQRVLTIGDAITLDGYLAEVLEVRDDRAVRVRFQRQVGLHDNGSENQNRSMGEIADNPI